MKILNRITANMQIFRRKGDQRRLQKYFKVVLFTVTALVAHESAGADMRLSIGIGSLDVLDETRHGAYSLMLEGPQYDVLWSIRPIGLLVYSDEGRYYAGLGVFKELDISERWVVGVGTGAGTYHEGNSEKDLGYDVEFYSRITLAYRLAKAGQIRAELGHLSNADLSSVNPGTELFSINWVFEFY